MVLGPFDFMGCGIVPLTVTFIVLAYTGFALKDPEAWWNFPFKLVKIHFKYKTKNSSYEAK